MNDLFEKLSLEDDCKSDEQESDGDESNKQSDGDESKQNSEIVRKTALPQLSQKRLKELQGEGKKTRKTEFAHITQISKGVEFVRERHDTKSAYYLVACPHCNCTVQIEPSKIACRIFRHGVFKKNGMAVPPHAKQKDCEQLIRKQKIYGCGKPFTFNGEFVEACEYI